MLFNFYLKVRLQPRKCNSNFYTTELWIWISCIERCNTIFSKNIFYHFKIFYACPFTR